MRFKYEVRKRPLLAGGDLNLSRYTPPNPYITERMIDIIDERMTEELVQLITQQRIEVRCRSEAGRLSVCRAFELCCV